jgi:hypothetical protein
MLDSVLVDTSVWVDHLREGDHILTELLEQGAVVCHPFIIGELACGAIKNRKEILGLLNDLPSTAILDHADAMGFIEWRQLMNKGIGYIDVHLLGSALASEVSLWTFDKALQKMADCLSIRYEP